MKERLNDWLDKPITWRDSFRAGMWSMIITIVIYAIAIAYIYIDDIKDFFEEGKYIGAICAAPTVLANLGLLKGKRITCHPTVEQDIQGAVITKVPVTVDNNVITGRGAGAAVDFALKLIEVLAGSDKAKEIGEMIAYERI